MKLSQMVKVVSCLAPVDSNGAAKDHGYVSLKNYDKVMFIVQVGNLAGDVTLTVEEAEDNAGTNATAIAFEYAKATTGAAALSVLDGALTAATSAGITLANASDDNKVWVIEVKASDLTNTRPYVHIATTDPSAAGLINSVALCYKAAYQGNPARMPNPNT